MFYLLRVLFLSFAAVTLSLHGAVDPVVCKHVDTIVYFSYTDVKNYPQYKDLFIAYAKKNITHENLNVNPLPLLCSLYFNEYTTITDELLQYVDKGTISVPALEKVYQKLDAVTQQKIQEISKTKWAQSPIKIMTMLDIFNGTRIAVPTNLKPNFLSQTGEFECTAGLEDGTQTEYHCCKNLSAIIPLIKTYAHKYQDPEVRAMLLKAFSKEVSESKKGNYVFWHGRQWSWDFKADMFKHIYNLKATTQNQIGSDYIPLRFGDGINDGFCMNYALFGNSKWESSSTLSYVLRNHDYSNGKSVHYSTHNFFRQFTLENFYPKYAPEFERLEQLHSDANRNGYGSLLLVSIEPKDIHRVYRAQRGSMGISTEDVWLNNEYTHDSKKIIDALRLNDAALHESDYIEFAMRLTDDYALDHTKGLHIYSFNAADQTKMQEYYTLRDSIFSSLTADLKAAGIIK